MLVVDVDTAPSQTLTWQFYGLLPYVFFYCPLPLLVSRLLLPVEPKSGALVPVLVSLEQLFPIVYGFAVWAESNQEYCFFFCSSTRL